VSQKSSGCRRPALSILTTAALVAIAGSASAAAVPKPSADPFYKPTRGYAATKPGTILRTRRLTLTPGTTVASEGAAAVYQVLYRTTDEHGSPSATVATIFVPSHRTGGRRRLVSYQIADDSLTTACAPSYQLRLPIRSQRLTIGKFTIGTNDPIKTMLALAWDVVTSDYEGPRSELLVSGLEGRMTLDGIRAAEQLRAAGLPGKATEVALFGYSGGSVPSVSAGRLAPTYAPDVRLVAVTDGGIDADPLYILAHIDGSLLFGGVTLGLIGIDRAYPQLAPFSLLNAAGIAIARKDAVDGYGCAGGVAAQAFGTAAKYTDYPSSQALAAVPRVKPILAKLNSPRVRSRRRRASSTTPFTTRSCVSSRSTRWSITGALLATRSTTTARALASTSVASTHTTNSRCATSRPGSLGTQRRAPARAGRTTRSSDATCAGSTPSEPVTPADPLPSHGINRGLLRARIRLSVGRGWVASRGVVGRWQRGRRYRFWLAGGRVGPSRRRAGVVGRASLR